jgi:hypothetical protein
MTTSNLIDDTQAATDFSPRSHSNVPPSAIRMARLRERRQRGFRCCLVEVCEADIDALVARGFLDRQRRNNPGAVERAIGGLLDRL